MSRLQSGRCWLVAENAGPPRTLSMCVRVHRLGQEPTRAERPTNSILCGTHGWQWFICRSASSGVAGQTFAERPGVQFEQVVVVVVKVDRAAFPIDPRAALSDL
jgi:hypothetical protein